MKKSDDKLYNRRRGAIMWAIAMTVCMPLGIVMTVLGFKAGGAMFAVGGIGIALTVAGFYGSPFLWIHFGTLTYYMNLKTRIISENIRSVAMLSELTGKKPKVVANDVKAMIQKNYLPDYVVLDDEKIVDKAAMAAHDYSALEAERAGSLDLVHCPFCNAKVALILDVGTCPYCQSKITKEMVGGTLTAYNKQNQNEA